MADEFDPAAFAAAAPQQTAADSDFDPAKFAAAKPAGATMNPTTWSTADNPLSWLQKSYEKAYPEQAARVARMADAPRGDLMGAGDNTYLQETRQAAGQALSGINQAFNPLSETNRRITQERTKGSFFDPSALPLARGANWLRGIESEFALPAAPVTGAVRTFGAPAIQSLDYPMRAAARTMFGENAKLPPELTHEQAATEAEKLTAGLGPRGGLSARPWRPPPLTGEIIPPEPPPPPGPALPPSGPTIEGTVATPRDNGALLLPPETPHAPPPGSRPAVGAAGTPGRGPLSDFSQEAIDKIRGQLAEEGFTGDEVGRGLLEQRLDEMSQHGYLGELTPGMENRFGRLATHPGASRSEIWNSLTTRGGEAPARMDALFDRTIGNYQNRQDLTRAFEVQRQQASLPFYQAFRNARVAPTPQLDAIMPRLQAAGALGAANKALAIEGRPATNGFFVPGDDGVMNVQQVPTTEAFQYAKEHLDGLIERALAEPGGGPAARRFAQLKNDLVTAVDEHPDPHVAGIWQQARNAYAAPSELIAAQKLGGQILSNNIHREDLPALIASYSPPQMRQLLVGVRGSLEDLAASNRNPARQTNKLLDAVLSPSNQQKLRAVLPDEKVKELVEGARHEEGMHGAPGRIIHGSQTGARTTGPDEWARQPTWWEAVGPEDVPLGPGQAAMAGVRKVGEHVRAAALARAEEEAARLRAEVAKIYTLQGSERDAALRQLLRDQPRLAASGENDPFSHLRPGGGGEPAPLERKVIERGRSGRPTKTEPLRIGTEQQILEKGYERATEQPQRPGFGEDEQEPYKPPGMGHNQPPENMEPSPSMRPGEVALRPGIEPAPGKVPGRDGRLNPMPVPPNLNARLNRMDKRTTKPEAGEPNNSAIKLPDGIHIGNVNLDQWIHRTEAVLTPDEIAAARNWYREALPVYEKYFGDKGSAMLGAWLTANVNATPSFAQLSAVRTLEQYLNKTGNFAKQKEGGLADAKLKQYWDAILSGDLSKLGQGGSGQKIYDFVDASLLKDTRTFYGDHPMAGAPAVADVHSLRDMGFIDGRTLNWINERAKEFGWTAAQRGKVLRQITRDSANLSPGEAQYEWAANKMRAFSDQLNERGYMGGNWSPLELQAVGWTSMSKLFGAPAETSALAIQKNIRNLSYELAFGEGAPYNKKFADFHQLSPDQQATVASNVLPDIVDFAKQVAGAHEYQRISGLGGWKQWTNPSFKSRLIASPEVAGDIADMIGYLGQQTGILHYRLEASGPKHGIAVHGDGLQDPATVATLWKKLVDRHGDLVDGFSPAIDPDGVHGIELLFNRGGKGTLANIEQKLIPTIDEIAKEMGVAVDIDHFNASMELREHDWKADKTGRSYLQRLSARYGPAISRRLELYKRQQLEPKLRAEIDRARGAGGPGGPGPVEGPRPEGGGGGGAESVREASRSEPPLKGLRDAPARGSPRPEDVTYPPNPGLAEEGIARAPGLQRQGPQPLVQMGQDVVYPFNKGFQYGSGPLDRPRAERLARAREAQAKARKLQRPIRRDESFARGGVTPMAEGGATKNAPYVRPIPSTYRTDLGATEPWFRAWVAKNKVPFNPDAASSDYDMRGFYQGLMRGDPRAHSAVDPNDKRLHFPDTWKTPEHQTFSNQSQWATDDAPQWNERDQLVAPSGRVLFDDRADAPPMASGGTAPSFAQPVARMAAHEPHVPAIRPASQRVASALRLARNPLSRPAGRDPFG